MVRIQYTKINDNEIKSNILTSDKGVRYYAKINFLEGFYKIFNASRRNCIKTGCSKNRNVLRRMVRRELQGLGVKLYKEFKKSGYAVL